MNKKEKQQAEWAARGVLYELVGVHDGHKEILTLYPDRFEFVRRSMRKHLFHTAPPTESATYASITNVDIRPGRLLGKLTIQTGVKTIEVDGVVNELLEEARDKLLEQSEAQSPTPTSEASPPSEDVTEKLLKLGQLRDQGILTNEEFDAKKAELLARL